MAILFVIHDRIGRLCHDINEIVTRLPTMPTKDQLTDRRNRLHRMDFRSLTMEELAQQPPVRVVNALCPSGTSLISNCVDVTKSKRVTGNSPKNLSTPKNLDQSSKRQEWIPKRCYKCGTMGHTRRFCTQLALTKVYRVKQPPTPMFDFNPKIKMVVKMKNSLMLWMSSKWTI